MEHKEVLCLEFSLEELRHFFCNLFHYGERALKDFNNVSSSFSFFSDNGDPTLSSISQQPRLAFGSSLDNVESIFVLDVGFAFDPGDKLFSKFFREVFIALIQEL